MTDERIEIYNQCYEFSQDVAAASKRIKFELGSTQRRLFTLRPSSRTKTQFLGTLKPKKSKTACKINLKQNKVLEFTNTSPEGSASLQICALPVKNGICPIETPRLAPGDKLILPFKNFPEGANQITITNPDKVKKGKFKVRIILKKK